MTLTVKQQVVRLIALGISGAISSEIGFSFRCTPAVVGETKCDHLCITLHAKENRALAQIVPDSTLGTERSIVTPVNPLSDRINGGAIRGTNLFHSFSDFNVNEGRAAYFANPNGIENILSRVTGTNPSHIFGKLGVLGNANLFLLNPNGVIFGANATLDLRGSFITSTANSIIFTDGILFSATNPETQPLLTINVPIGLQFGTNQPGAILNMGSLAVELGQNLALVGGTVVSTGQLAAPNGQLVVTAISSNRQSPEDATLVNSSLPQLLTNWEGNEISGFTLNKDGGVELAGDNWQIDTGDVVVQHLRAGTATLVADNNLTLVESELHTTGNLNLLALDTIRVRDSVATPFRVQTGGNLHIQGNFGIDILALNHPQTPFQSAGNLTLVSDGIISGDAHFSSGGDFSVLNLSGKPGNFISLYDPIISSQGNVMLANYEGASLKIEAMGDIRVQNITITQPDTMLVGSDPDIPILTRSPALILRAGVSELEHPPNTEMRYTIADLSTLPGANSSSALGINDAGQVVGISGGRAFLWNSNTGMQNLSTFGRNVSRALGVNNAGQVVGEFDGRAFLWDSSSGIQDLGTLGGNFSAALAINNAGQVAGISTTGNGNEVRAFFWESSTGMQNLGTLPNFPSDSIARGINDTGQVVGESGDCNVGCSAFLWNSDTGMQNLGTLGRNVSRALGVNNAGQVVGESNGRAFLWDSSNGMQNLGTLPGDNFSRAWDINNAGQVVGESGNRTFLLQNGVMSDLNNLILSGSGWSNLLDARAINDAGQIIGSGEIEGQTHAFLMTPIETSPALPGSGSITIANVETIGGPIILSAANDINATGIINSNGGDISFESGGSINTVTATINSASLNQAGNIALNGQSVFLTEGTLVSASTIGSGQGGNVTVNASETLELTGFSRLLTETGGAGNAGNLEVNTHRLIIRDGSAISASVGEESTGQGGNLTINAESVELIGIAPDGRLPSRLAVGTAGTQRAGDLTVNTSRLSIRGGAAISTGTSSSAQGGNLTVNADVVELIGTSANSMWISILLADTGGAGNAGDLTVNTEQLIVREGAAVSSSTVNRGLGGNLTVNASDFVELSGTANNGFASGLYAQAFADGDAGNLIIDTGELRIFDGAKVTVAAGSAADARVPVNLLPGIGVDSPPDRATGDAGNLEAKADSIYLNNQGGIIASTDAGEGGNINLEAQDWLLMRYNSLISAKAGGTGNGGNVTIDAPFIIGVREEDSDIIANAFQGNGGRVTITTTGIYGLQFRDRLTPLSDISASSEFGVDGVVEINTPDIDPSRGLSQLPAEPVNPQLDQRCQGSHSQATSRFVNTGRGGLPLSPDEISNNTVWDDVRSPTASENNASNASTVPKSDRSDSSILIEAQGWVKLPDGRVILTAQAPTATLESSPKTSANCQIQLN